MYFTLTAYLNLDEPDLRVQQLHMTGGCCVEQCRSGVQSWEAEVGELQASQRMGNLQGWAEMSTERIYKGSDKHDCAVFRRNLESDGR